VGVGLPEVSTMAASIAGEGRPGDLAMGRRGIDGRKTE
jgi:hypothetical protein